ncbi:MAG: ATPase, partial [Phycisphaerales bacterium]|nr:ATPase [Phycisphaerales bacterium]
MLDGTPPPPPATAPVGTGGMAELVRTKDWSRTPLGPMDGWPPSLRTVVGVCLGSRFPMFVWWGPDLVNLYNDAYVPILGRRHPDALGRSAPDLWREVWPMVGPQVEAVMTRGEASWHRRVPLVLERNGYPEEAYFTWSHSPVAGEDGRVGGVLCVVNEETEWVVAEKERDRLAAQRQLALDAARMGWWHYDPATKVSTFDRRYTEIFGVTGHQRPNEEILRRIHPDDLPGVWAKVEAALDPSDPKPYSADYRIVLDDGSVRWVEAHGTASFAGEGRDRRATNLVGTIADVTDRRLAEAAVREAEQRYRAVFETSRDAKIIYAPDGTVVEANPAACRMYGYAADEIVGVRAPDVIHPDALPMFREFLRVAGAGGEFACETVDRRRDGTAFPIEVVGTSFESNGRTRLMSVVRDITDRRRTMDRLGRLYAVAAALSDAVTPADVARVAVDQGIAALGATAGSLALLAEGGSELEMAGSVGYPPGTMDAWQRFPVDAPVPLAEAVRLGEPVYVESPEDRLRRYPALAAVTARGGTSASACVPLVTAGRAVGVLGLSFDRPGGFSAEDRAFMLSLGRQCAQALERARLFDAERHARREAERQGRMKDEFLATLSHELRTPLNAILGWAQVLRASGAGDPEDVRQGLATIERNARAQARMIEDLLDMSRIISGKIRVDVRRVRVGPVVEAAVETVRPAADAKGVRLHVDVDPRDGPVAGDPARLQQVVWNLVSNSVKHCAQGGHVRVRLARRDDAHLEVSVADDGEGISPDFLPFVFDRFRQADGSTTRRHGGLGLGLSIVSQLVELHGGTVRAASAGPGKGATFTVTLPLAPAAADPDPPPAGPGSAGG